MSQDQLTAIDVALRSGPGGAAVPGRAARRLRAVRWPAGRAGRRGHATSCSAACRRCGSSPRAPPARRCSTCTAAATSSGPPARAPASRPRWPAARARSPTRSTTGWRPSTRSPPRVEDALAAYRALLDDRARRRSRWWSRATPPAAGSRSRCSLAARDEGLPLPAAVAVMSPWVDLTLSGESLHAKEADDADLRRGGHRRVRVPLPAAGTTPPTRREPAAGRPERAAPAARPGGDERGPARRRHPARGPCGRGARGRDARGRRPGAPRVPALRRSAGRGGPRARPAGRFLPHCTELCAGAGADRRR